MNKLSAKSELIAQGVKVTRQAIKELRKQRMEKKDD